MLAYLTWQPNEVGIIIIIILILYKRKLKQSGK